MVLQSPNPKSNSEFYNDFNDQSEWILFFNSLLSLSEISDFLILVFWNFGIWDWEFTKPVELEQVIDGFQFCEYYSHNFVYADSKLDLIQIDLITRPQLSGRAFSFCSAQRGPFSLNNSWKNERKKKNCLALQKGWHTKVRISKCCP